MRTGGIAILALASLRRHPVRTFVLAATVGIVVGLPLVIDAALGAYVQTVTARARNTPLLVGPWGGATDLLLDALYLRRNTRASIERYAITRACEEVDAGTISLHLRHGAAGFPLVGTDLDYFSLRKLRCADGKLPLRLGDCVLGAEVAKSTGLGAGETLLSDPEGVLDVVGGFGTRLRITGVLAPRGTADDRAVFCDIKTTWVIDGIGHGHENVDGPILYGDVPAAPVDLTQHRAVDAENLESFHFHGDPETFPISAAIIVPETLKDSLLVRGRLTTIEDGAQAIVPTRALDDLLSVVLRIQGIVEMLTVTLGAATGLLLLLVGFLALRLRRVELLTLSAIGVSRRAIVALIASEWFFVLLAGVAVALLLAAATRRFGAEILESTIIHM
jgi:putative ABC transport system permease protein